MRNGVRNFKDLSGSHVRDYWNRHRLWWRPQWTSTWFQILEGPW